MLAFSALMFYLPKLAWNFAEDGRMANICEEIDSEGKSMRHTIHDQEKIARRIEKILRSYMKGDWHRKYTISMIACECLNFVAVLVVWYSTDYFLDYRFKTYGGDLYKWFQGLMDGNYEPLNNIDTYGPTDAVFPKVTKCTFHTFGFSGSQQRIDGLCVLMLNIINEKFFAILWYWYIIAGILAAGMIIRRILMFLHSDMMA